MKTTTFILLAALLLGLAQPSRAADLLSETLQKGLFEEEANHNLDAAIKAYQSVLQQTDEQRKLAATAVFRLGECYRKLGRTNDAIGQYERILQEFSGETPLATLSRQNLAGLGVAPKTPPPQAVSKAARSEQKRLLELEIKLVENQVETIQKQVANGVASSDALIPKEREILALRRQLAGLDLGADETSPLTQPLGLTASTDEEEKEVQRIKAVIKDSPDLINSPGQNKRTPLHNAAAAGQLVVARFLLANKADVNSRASARKETPLQLAAEQGHKSMTEFLLANGADVNAGSSYATGTALHAAAEHGFKSVAEALVANKADVNAKNGDGDTPLHTAIVYEQNPIAELLLANGAEVNAKNSKGLTPLYVAVRGNHPSMVDLFLARKADITVKDGNGWTPLRLAVMQNRLSIAESLLHNGADGSLKGEEANPLLQATFAAKSPDMLKLLLSYKPDLEALNSDGLTLLQEAIVWGPTMTLDIVQILIEAGADANARFRPIGNAQWLDRNAAGNPGNIVIREMTPLMVAALKGRGDFVEALLQHGADITAKSQEGKTALHLAVEKGYLPIVQAILARHPDTEVRDVEGFTPLLRAGQAGAKTLEALIKAGADVNVRFPNMRETFLHDAVAWRSKELVELLVTNKADVNAIDKNGDTPLVYALRAPGSGALEQARLREISAFLLAHGADENIRRRSFISLSRKDRNLSAPVFFKGTNSINRYTLLELVAAAYGAGETDYVFPDFGHVKIRKLLSKPGPDAGSSVEVNVDVYEIFRSTECGADAPLDWGDIVEVPELDHAINDHWRGLPQDTLDMLQKCLKREVEFVVKGERTRKILAPFFKPPSQLGSPVAYGGGFIQPNFGAPHLPPPPGRSNDIPPAIPDPWAGVMNFRLRNVLTQANVVRLSSDLSRVKVKRLDPKTGKAQDLVFDLSENLAYDARADLWLRDGDVIEVPEK